jgi:hypothetical protein
MKYKLNKKQVSDMVDAQLKWWEKQLGHTSTQECDPSEIDYYQGGIDALLSVKEKLYTGQE